MEPRTKLFLTLLVGVAVLHGFSLGGGFVWDDHQMIEENADLRDIGRIPGAFGTNYFGDRANVGLFRPLVNVTLTLDWHLWGHRDGRDGPEAVPLGFRLSNLLLHLSAGLLLYGLLRRITDRPPLAELGALLFLVHPASAEPVAWIVGRGDLLATVLTLATIHLHLAGRRRPVFHALALLTYLAALFGKLVSGPAPLLILLVETAFRGLRPRDLLRVDSAWRYASYLLPLVVYSVVRVEAMGMLTPRGVGVAWTGAEEVGALFVAGAILFRMGWLFLVPVGMCADYSADPVFDPERLKNVTDGAAVPLMAFALVGVLLVAIALRRRRPWLAFGVFWFFLGLLPVAQVVRIGAVMADRFLYLPAAGACAALAAGIVSLPRFRFSAGVLILACFAALTVEREAVWRSDLTMNLDVVAKSNYPGNSRAWNRLGLFYRTAGRPDLEEAAYRRGLEHAGGNRFLLKNLGALEYERGRFGDARRHLEKALRLSKSRDLQKAKIAYNLSLVLNAEGEWAGAALVLEEAVLCRPKLALAYERLARLYRDRLGRPGRAEDLFREAERLRER